MSSDLIGSYSSHLFPGRRLVLKSRKRIVLESVSSEGASSGGSGDPVPEIRWDVPMKIGETPIGGF